MDLAFSPPCIPGPELIGRPAAGRCRDPARSRSAVGQGALVALSSSIQRLLPAAVPLKFLMIREKRCFADRVGMAPFGPASKHEAKPGSQCGHPDFEDASVSSAAPIPDREECT